MGVRLKRKPVPAARPRSGSSVLPTSMERAVLAVLMYFPPTKTRGLASDILVNYEPCSRENIAEIVRAIGRYGAKKLAVVDPDCHVLRALKSLRRFADKNSVVKKAPRAPARAIGKLVKCRPAVKRRR